MKIVWFLLFLVSQAQAQTNDAGKLNTGEYEGVAGNPFFIKDWSDGIVRFSSGKESNKFKLKFNAAQNRLLLQFNGSTFAAESQVKEFVLFTKNKKDSFLFRKGFPVYDRGNSETFYQVLESGKATLLHLAAKDIVEEKEILASKVSRSYTDINLFFIFRDGVLIKIDKESATLPEILSDRGEELKTFIAEQQLKMRTTEDFIKVVRKYNELQR